ncbi:mitochondrial 54S ribosomal protein bL34m KNAG_0H03220 [Huiozyma naganishii CBS 8797]|uniref:Large ribosomal subunit protein bL34m n=1 Tax=Huiozyma naganishii (strain ATCC MYA-139 / BCRC 22969 / CBS 8797 / KCTC 17520 / NBRC 10181 / NCYC 3082 / Yp74L-3) TaxID=1071383 RepID=J7S1Z2_HUIN7|nr:hypothetical protein KNAG_0H03220 [Kazachstania naganishii CBS 8797]CCK71737.1 hypothetical protein KNAG_0H03220 [Kazachstania naganishii CBS 8797]
MSLLLSTVAGIARTRAVGASALLTGGIRPTTGVVTLTRRWKSRGNTYQPSTLKRKRKFGFLARVRASFRSKVLKRRKEKGRWYLSH